MNVSNLVMAIIPIGIEAVIVIAVDITEEEPAKEQTGQSDCYCVVGGHAETPALTRHSGVTSQLSSSAKDRIFRQCL